MAETLEQRLARLASEGGAPATASAPAEGESLEQRLLRLSGTNEPPAGFKKVPPKTTTEAKTPPYLKYVYDNFIQPFAQHPERNVGGIVGRALATPASLASGGTMAPVINSLGAGLGGAFGQAIENIRHDINMPITDYYANVIEAFLEQGAASGGADLMDQLAQKLVRYGVPGAARWVASKATRGKIAAPTPKPELPSGPQYGVVPTKSQLKAKAATEQSLGSVRSSLPEAPDMGTVQLQLPGKANKALAESYKTREGARLATAKAASSKYGPYQKVINHPENTVAPGELTLREAVEDAEGNIIKDAVLNKTPWRTPVEISPFRTEIEQLAELEAANPFPAGHPVKRFLQAINNGYNYVEYDALKKALGKLSVFINSKQGLPSNDVQGLAKQLLKKLGPLMDDALTTASERAGEDPAATAAAREAGDVAWARYRAMFGKLTPSEAKAKAAFVEQRAARPQRTVSPAPTPARTAWQKPKPPDSILRAGNAAEKKSLSAWLDHLTTGSNSAKNLQDYLDVMGDEHAPQLLRHVFEDIVAKKDWARWDKLVNNGVVDRLTQHAPDLKSSIPDVFKQLQRIQASGGNAATALERAAQSIRGATIVTPGHTVRWGMHKVANILENPELARRLNQRLKMQTVPKRAARKMGISQASIATTPPPPPAIAAEEKGE